jgi:hypothetical protein
MNIITLIGISIIMFYIAIQILNFYGIGPEVYGAYLLFYSFIIVSILILPNNYSKI